MRKVKISRRPNRIRRKPRDDRCLTPYNRFVRSAMKDPEIRDAPARERFGWIAMKWDRLKRTRNK